jgi:hypothetical protein
MRDRSRTAENYLHYGLRKFARFASNIIESQNYEEPNPEFLLITDKYC